MEKSKSPYSVPPEQVVVFLRNTLPFNELALSHLQELAKQCVIDFFPKGSLVFKQDVTDVNHFYLIQKGGVKIYLIDNEGEITLKDYRGEGEYFGALPIIQETKANLNVETIEDTFCFVFAKQAFLNLIQTVPKVAQYFLRSMSEKMINTAYRELRQHKISPKTESALYLFSIPVGDIVKGAPQMIAANDSVQKAATSMTSLHIGSLLVHDNTGEVVGIVTDKDLRTKVVAKGLDYHTAVQSVMTSPVQAIPAHTVCFDALLNMMRGKIHHLAVKKRGKIIGLITTHDIMVLQGTSPLYIFREILAQRHIEGLYPLAHKIPMVVRTLVEEGAKANNIARMITILNDYILERLLSLLIEELGTPPVPFCWLFMGSEGRREQTFKTDQDNAIIYQDPKTAAQAEEATKYFQIFGEKAIEHLKACGFPPCPGEIMASNPQWRQPAKIWQKYFDDWVIKPDPQEVRNATIFFDFRAGFGEQKLVRDLRDHLTRITQHQELFLLHLAKDCLEGRPPLSFFKHFIVERDGEHKNHLDLKKRGLVPFVDFARVMALKYGIQESNTPDRLRLLAENDHIPRELYKEAVEAYEFLMQLRLIHQMQMIEKDLQPDNHVRPGNLSDLEKQTLKEAFGVVRRLQGFVGQEFHIERT